MSEEWLEAKVRDSVRRHIDSVAQLEALLFFRAYPDEAWEAASVAKRLYASDAETVAALARLCADGFLEHDNSAYRYAPSPGHRADVDGLAEAYVHKLIPMTNLIHSKPRNIGAPTNTSKFGKDSG
jgi:hypothetical protein